MSRLSSCCAHTCMYSWIDDVRNSTHTHKSVEAHSFNTQCTASLTRHALHGNYLRVYRQQRETTKKHSAHISNVPLVVHVIREARIEHERNERTMETMEINHFAAWTDNGRWQNTVKADKSWSNLLACHTPYAAIVQMCATSLFWPINGNSTARLHILSLRKRWQVTMATAHCGCRAFSSNYFLRESSFSVITLAMHCVATSLPALGKLTSIDMRRLWL